MVQRKQARKKPKDPGVVLDGDGAPARGDPGSSRGPLPGYMRATTCSDAKAGAGARVAAPSSPPSKREPVRAKVVFAAAAAVAAAPRVGRATCSSTMKGPGVGGAHVCPYGYCSLKGHVHEPVEPLGSFVASRRRLIKTQQSMKLKGASPFRKPGNGGGFFVEVRAGVRAAAAPTVGSDASCSDLSAEEMDAMVRRMDYVVFDRVSYGDEVEGRARDLGASVDGSCGSSDVISDASVELLGTTKHRGRKEDEALVDHEDEDFGACKKVEMLVQAFETVLPTVTNDKKQLQQDGDEASFTLTRPSQAWS
nr:unnamed protein product [Digitaria exilis]